MLGLVSKFWILRVALYCSAVPVVELWLHWDFDNRGVGVGRKD